MSASITNSEKVLVPEIRFKGFDDYWEKYRMEQLADCYDGTHQTPKYVASGVPFVSVENVKSYATKSKFITKEAFDKNFKTKPKKGDVIMTRITAGIIGMTSIVENDDDLAYYVSVALIRKKKDIGSSFLAHRIESEGFKRELHKRIIHVAFPKKINLGDLQKCVTFTPSLPEQQKIASFLSAIDDKVQQLTKKKELLEQYKKGVMQQLFSGQLRFKDEEGKDYPDWEDSVMQDVFQRVKEKNKENNLNVMSISAQQGLVNQLEYFNRYVSAADVTGYYLLKKGDFAYNKSYSKGYPMGAIKRLDRYDKGVVSTLYICFRIKENDDSTFYKEFLDHGGINRELHKIAQEGARNHGLLNMSVTEFFRDIKIPRPSVEEQIVIGKFLEDLSIKIESSKEELTQTQTFKKGLLQQMFV
jgi:type I restriction enzyme S subunit